MNRFDGMILTEARASAYMEAGDWTNESFVDVLQRQAETYPDAVHKDELRSLTYRELWAEVESVAHGLYALGVRKGDKVAIQLPNALDYVIAVFGAARIGASAVLLQVDLGEQALRFSLTKSEASVWIVADSFRGTPLYETALRLQADLPTVRHVVLQGETAAGVGQGGDTVAGDVSSGPTTRAGAGAVSLSFAQLRASDNKLSADVIATNSPGPLDSFVMVFTSGTTGSPKGVVQLHANYLWASRAYARNFGYAPGQATLDLAPICHQTGMLAGVMMPIVSGGRIFLLERFSAGRVLRWIASEQPSYIVGAPPHVIHVANAPGLREADTSSVRLFIYAGAPVPSAVLRQLQTDSGMTVGAMFGWTEGFLATMTRPDDALEAIASTCGFAVEGTEVKLVDEDGRPVPQGEPGEMWSRGPNFSAGYYNNPQAAQRQWDADGWFHSGDLLRQDDAGRYIFMGRADDIINRGGTKVDPKSVEDACAEHGAVENVAVVGAPDATLGQRTIACIVLKEGAAPFALQELRDFLATKGLAKFQFPDRIEFLDALPTTHSGKIKKKDLRARFQAEAESAQETAAGERRNG